MCATSVDFDHNEVENRLFARLEGLVLEATRGSVPLSFRPSHFCYTNRTKNNSHPLGFVSGIKFIFLNQTSLSPATMCMGDIEILSIPVSVSMIFSQ